MLGLYHVGAKRLGLAQRPTLKTGRSELIAPWIKARYTPILLPGL